MHYTNISSINRQIRVYLGLALVLVGFGFYRGTMLGDMLMALSLPFLITGASGFCPVMSVLRLGHRHSKA